MNTFISPDGGYPRHVNDITSIGWAEGEALPAGWIAVEKVDPPQDGNIYKEEYPVLIDGKWHQKWSISAKTEPREYSSLSDIEKHLYSLGIMASEILNPPVEEFPVVPEEE